MLYQMMAMLFGPSLASSIVNATLGRNNFSVLPPFVKKPTSVSFICGNPLGYCSSWPLFALSHHFMVWLAADRAYPDGEEFKAYAILGDDVVIADSRVAEEYSLILGQLGVDISTQKKVSNL